MGSSLEVLDQLDCKVIALKELWIILGWNSSIFCALRHFFCKDGLIGVCMNRNNLCSIC